MSAATESPDSITSVPTTSLDPQKLPHCLKCGYSLTGLTEPRCPECGREFDPLDPRSFQIGPLNRLQRAALAAPGRIFNGAAVATAILTCAAAAPPGGYFLLILIVVKAWIVLAAVWVVRSILRGIAASRANATLSKADARRWAFAPTAFLATILLVVLSAPFWFTYWVSRPFMDSVAQQSRSEMPNAPMIGLYPVARIERIEGGIRFRIWGGGFLNETGFAYCPDHPPPAYGEDLYKHVSDGWYSWIEHW